MKKVVKFTGNQSRCHLSEVDNIGWAGFLTVRAVAWIFETNTWRRQLIFDNLENKFNTDRPRSLQSVRADPWRFVVWLVGSIESRRGRETLAQQERRSPNCVEVWQTRTNSDTPENGGNDRRKPMNYGEWSKSIKLDQTLTPNFAGSWIRGNWREDFEQKITKVTKGRESQQTFGWSLVLDRETTRSTGKFVKLNRTASKSDKLEQTRTPQKTR